MSADLSTLLLELKKDYVAALPQKMAQIEALDREGQVEALRNEFHKLKGTGKTYGLPDVSELSEAVERICEVQQEDLSWVIPAALKVLRKIHANHLTHTDSRVDQDADFIKIRQRFVTL